MQWLTAELVLVLLGTCAVHAAVPFQSYILAPPSRIIKPVSVHQANGSVSTASGVLQDASAGGALVLNGTDAGVTYDFGKNIGGWVTLTVGSTPARNQSVHVTFSESSLWISGAACDATADSGLDAPLVFELTHGAGNYTAPQEQERGAFRYLSVVSDGPGTVEITGVTVHFTAMPHWADNALQNYTGYFHSSDEQLNRIWYAGAYTNQLVTIDPKRGDALTHVSTINSSVVDGTNSWFYNFTITNGTSALTDGAKRDRLVWPGDMAIAVPGLAVSTSDFITVANSLDSLFDLQNKTTGLLPYAGMPFSSRNIVSFTYHLYSLIGVADYFQWTGDVSYLQDKWTAWQLGMNWTLAQIDSTGLANITASADWLRFGMGSHNIEANSILYHTLGQGIALAAVLNDSSGVAATYQSARAGIAQAANKLLWNETAGLFRDNETTSLFPQDGNVWAVKSGLVTNATRALSISQGVQQRWTKFGAPAPEAADAISPFISGFELEAHFAVNRTSAALDLMRMMWGDFMLDDPRMTNSTFIEGYSTTGELHYAPYTNDPRISHAHGWATGPTSTLTTYIAGIQLLTPAGATWAIAPQLGDLSAAQAGFQTSLGSFSSSWALQTESTTNDTLLRLNVTTPAGTSGSIGVPTNGGSGVLSLLQGDNSTATTVNYTSDPFGRYWLTGLKGGSFSLALRQTNATDSTDSTANLKSAAPVGSAVGMMALAIPLLVGLLLAL